MNNSQTVTITYIGEDEKLVRMDVLVNRISGMTETSMHTDGGTRGTVLIGGKELKIVRGFLNLRNAWNQYKLENDLLKFN